MSCRVSENLLLFTLHLFLHQPIEESWTQTSPLGHRNQTNSSPKVRLLLEDLSSILGYSGTGHSKSNRVLQRQQHRWRNPLLDSFLRTAIIRVTLSALLATPHPALLPQVCGHNHLSIASQVPRSTSRRKSFPPLQFLENQLHLNLQFSQPVDKTTPPQPMKTEYWGLRRYWLATIGSLREQFPSSFPRS